MFRDCLRCGYGWHGESPFGGCVCSGMNDEQAAYLKSVHEYATRVRRIARKAFNSPQYSGLTTEEGREVGLYL